jgi:glycine cleavage system H protein
MTTLYTREHEWIRIEGDEGVVGITAFAAEKLGDVVFVDLPDAGRQIVQNGEMAVVESVKAASDVYAPVSGAVIAANDVLSASPETVNADPEGAGWFCRIRIADASQLTGLMTRDQYQAFCSNQ